MIDDDDGDGGDVGGAEHCHHPCQIEAMENGNASQLRLKEGGGESSGSGGGR